MLGREVVDIFSATGHSVSAPAREELNICSSENVRRHFRLHRPDWVVHTAAMTDVDGCEHDPDRAYQVNAIGSGILASACADNGAVMAMVSTDFVFDGEARTPYDEFAVTKPLGAYGGSKLAGETLTRASGCRHHVIRTSWLFGQGKCFPATMITAARAGKSLKVVDDQVGSPTFTRDLAFAMLDVLNTGVYGTVHVSNAGACSWYNLACAALEEAGLGEAAVTPIRAEDWPTPTRRPAYSVLRGMVRELQGRPQPRHWREALTEWFALYGPSH